MQLSSADREDYIGTMNPGHYEVRPNRRVNFVHKNKDTNADTVAFMVHGGGGRCDQFRKQIEHLAGKGVEVVAFDWLGHGDSEKIDEWDIYAFEELYTDLLTIFETFSRKEAKNIVIGHSIGSAMSVFLTSRTQKVDGLVLLATNHQMPSGIGLPIWYAPAWLLSASRPILSRGFADKAWHVTTDRKLVEEEAIKAENNSISIAKAVYRQMKWPTEQDFKSISIPTVIVAGETDGITPGENSKIVHSWIETSSSHVEFHTLPNTSHNLMLEKPEEVNKLIDGLIYKLLADKK